jgi:hypothetical protein
MVHILYPVGQDDSRLFEARSIYANVSACAVIGKYQCRAPVKLVKVGPITYLLLSSQ